jgi:hypothetical protein
MPVTQNLQLHFNFKPALPRGEIRVKMAAYATRRIP